MNFDTIKETAKALFTEAGFIARIKDNTDYEQALALMDELIDDYDEHEMLIEVLVWSIEQWENSAPEFAEFNKRVGIIPKPKSAYSRYPSP